VLAGALVWSAAFERIGVAKVAAVAAAANRATTGPAGAFPVAGAAVALGAWATPGVGTLPVGVGVGVGVRRVPVAAPFPGASVVAPDALAPDVVAPDAPGLDVLAPDAPALDVLTPDALALDAPAPAGRRFARRVPTIRLANKNIREAANGH